MERVRREEAQDGLRKNAGGCEGAAGRSYLRRESSAGACSPVCFSRKPDRAGVPALVALPVRRFSQGVRVPTLRAFSPLPPLARLRRRAASHALADPHPESLSRQAPGRSFAPVSNPPARGAQESPEPCLLALIAPAMAMAITTSTSSKRNFCFFSSSVRPTTLRWVRAEWR